MFVSKSVIVLLVLGLGANQVSGHGHLTAPRSRNFYAAEDGSNAPGIPIKEYCPHCLNTNSNICGNSPNHNYDDYLDSSGNKATWVSQLITTAGSIIDVKSYLDTHHNGHMELRACPEGETATLGCFEAPGNELTFVEDVAFNMPADPNYPERGYYYGGQGGGHNTFHMKFKLPEHIVGDKVLLRWTYITANSCSPPGYSNYFNGGNSQGVTLPSSFWTSGVTDCTPPYPSDGTRSTTWPEQFFNCAEITVNPSTPTISPRPTPSPTTRSPSYTPMPTSTWETPGGPACCSQNFRDCVTWCGSTKEECESCNNDVLWLPSPPTGCLARYEDCTSDSNCCPGLSCEGNEYYSQCKYDSSQTLPPAGLTPSPPEPAPEPAPPVTPSPIASTPAPVPTTPFPTYPPTEMQLFSTANTLSTWDAYQEIVRLKLEVSTEPPIFAYTASGGAAGNGNVVSESQGYGLLITGIILASWDTHKESRSNTDRNSIMRDFEGYFNGWKQMCQNSNVAQACQGSGEDCMDDEGTKSVCLPGWKHANDLSSEIGTGSAPDGDIDAITGMILGLKAVENDSTKPSWYDEVKNWAHASCTSFLRWNTVERDGYRILKLGSCWGGWDGNGQNPSYHSPGSFKIMRDFQASIDANSPSNDWNALIATSYKVLSATQCPDEGIVPNWATIKLENGVLKTAGIPFSGSGTPQNEYGAEAGRTMWRVALDAAAYPDELGQDPMTFMEPLLSTLSEGYDDTLSFNEKYWKSETFDSCQPPYYGANDSVYPFSGGWKWNAFVFAPTVSSLVVPYSQIDVSTQQAMIDAVGSVLANDIPSDYYAASWTVLSILMVNGAVQSAGATSRAQAPEEPVTAAPVTTAPITSAPITTAPVTTAPITTAPVTKSPTSSDPVTAAPITPIPTRAPITPAPVTPAPTPAPTPVDNPVNNIPLTGTACCTQHFDTCIHSGQWCAAPERCGKPGCTYVTWMPNGVPVDPNACAARYQGCATKDCCPGLVCVATDSGWKGCQTPADAESV